MELDTRKLKESKVLSTSIQDDRRRREIDDAKKRAAAQNVDYPAFSALVSAAHLKPVDQNSLKLPKLEGKLSPAWSFDSSGVIATPSPSESKLDFSNTSSRLTPKSLTGDSFRKYWSQLSTTKERSELLAKMPATAFRDIFRVEIPTFILDSILETLNQHMVDMDCAHVLALLDCLSECPRFAISLKLGKPKLASQLLDQVDVISGNNAHLCEMADGVRAKYALGILK